MTRFVQSPPRSSVRSGLVAAAARASICSPSPLMSVIGGLRLYPKSRRSRARPDHVARPGPVVILVERRDVVKAGVADTDHDERAFVLVIAVLRRARPEVTLDLGPVVQR